MANKKYKSVNKKENKVGNEVKITKYGIISIYKKINNVILIKK